EQGRHGHRGGGTGGAVPQGPQHRDYGVERQNHDNQPHWAYSAGGRGAVPGGRQYRGGGGGDGGQVARGRLERVGAGELSVGDDSRVSRARGIGAQRDPEPSGPAPHL